MGILNERLLIHEIPVEVRVNTRRRTRIGMTLDPEGFVVLDVPKNSEFDEIVAVVGEHRRWLRYRLKALESATGHSTRLNFASGEVVHLLGNPLYLRVTPDLYCYVHISANLLYVYTPDTSPAAVEALVLAWYHDKAQQVFTDVLEKWRDLPWISGGLPKWRHSYMRSQWGSCSAKGTVSLNTHLIKTPLRLIEYVVLHELCHLRHHNHGKRFHALMSKHLPDWPRRSSDLNKYLSILLQH